MAFGVDVVVGDITLREHTDTLEGSLAKAVKDKITTYVNGVTDVQFISLMPIGAGKGLALIVHV